MMPPTNRLGGALQMASQIASIATGISSSAGLLDFGQKTSTVADVGTTFSSRIDETFGHTIRTFD